MTCTSAISVWRASTTASFSCVPTFLASRFDFIARVILLALCIYFRNNLILHSSLHCVLELLDLCISYKCLCLTPNNWERDVRSFAHGAMGRGIGLILHGVDPLSYSLLLIGKSSPCGGSRFPISLSEWSLTICLTQYNRKIKCVECIVK